MQLPVAPAHTITSGTTTQHHHKCEVDGASILLDTKGVIRSRKTIKDGVYNGKKEKGQKHTQKPKIEQPEFH
jgi:hypothetical protein